MKAKGFLRKDIVKELSRFELAGLTQPHLPDTQSPDSAWTVEEAVFTDADRTDADRTDGAQRLDPASTFG